MTTAGRIAYPTYTMRQIAERFSLKVFPTAEQIADLGAGQLRDKGMIPLGALRELRGWLAEQGLTFVDEATFAFHNKRSRKTEQLLATIQASGGTWRGTLAQLGLTSTVVTDAVEMGLVDREAWVCECCGMVRGVTLKIKISPGA